MEIGKGRLLTEGEDVAIISIGTAGYEVLCALEILKEDNIFPAHYDMRFVKPLDSELLDLIFKKFSKIITVEDGALQGGFGSLIAEYAADNFYSAKIKRLGIPDKFIEHGSQQDLYELCGYDRKAIAKAVKEMIKM
jgi:1-deoxy-D-xylulose-5-phosphate synthase